MSAPTAVRRHGPPLWSDDLLERLEERVHLLKRVVVNERDADDSVFGRLLDSAEPEAGQQSGGVELQQVKRTDVSGPD